MFIQADILININKIRGMFFKNRGLFVRKSKKHYEKQRFLARSIMNIVRLGSP